MKHETRVERVGRKYRWACSCGEAGEAVTKGRAETGQAYHDYAKRAMTAAEVLTAGDGMNADLSYEEAAARASAMNEREGWG